MFERINSIELKQLEYQKYSEEKFNKIFDYIADHKEDNQKIFYDGQIFDAFSLLIDIVGRAKKEIVLNDGYIDVITLNILAKKNTGVDVLAYTLPSTRISAQDINSFNAQYPTLTVKRTTAFHDRFLIIDQIFYLINRSLNIMSSNSKEVSTPDIQAIAVIPWAEAHNLSNSVSFSSSLLSS